MLAHERQQQLLARLRERGTVRLAELQTELAVSPATLRRDVTRLADRGLLVRVHGGITLPRRERERAPLAATGPGRALVGMVCPSLEYYWPSVVTGAQTAASAAGARLVLRAAHYDAAEERRQAQQLLERGVQALLVAPTLDRSSSSELLRWLERLPVPTVLVERTPPASLSALRLDAVTTDHARGAGLAVRHLASLGHRRIGLVTSRPSPTSVAVRHGWAATSRELELPADLELRIDPYGSPGWEASYDRVLDRTRQQGVSALLVHSDREAIGLLARADERGLTVPGELAVVAYDDEVAAACDPPLTAVRPDKHRLGEAALELALSRRARGEQHGVHRLSLWPGIVVRESCGSLATEGGGP